MYVEALWNKDVVYTFLYTEICTNIRHCCGTAHSVHGALNAAGRTPGSLMPPTGYSTRFHTQMQEVPKPGFYSLFSLKSDLDILLIREERNQWFCKIQDRITWMYG